MRENKRRYLEESKCEIIEFLLLAESDEELLAELRVEEDLLLLEGELLLPSLAQHGVAQGGDVVADVVNTSLLLSNGKFKHQNINLEFYLERYWIIQQRIPLVIHGDRMGVGLVQSNHLVWKQLQQ